MERTPPVSIVIPVGNYHREIAEQAIASALAQSIYCPVIVVYDNECRGAGWARNRGLEQVATPFVAFLDSDDLLLQSFVEETLRFYDGRSYVFTDWIENNVVEAPCLPWDGTGAAHIVTTLLPTNYLRAIDGFDENLPGLEDTDLGWNLTRSGLCGRRLPKALVAYRKGGKRAQAFRDRDDSYAIGQSIIKRYEGKPMSCNGCGAGNSDLPTPPIGEPQLGDALATTLWAGNRQERGRMTGRLYPRSGNGKQLWVHPADIDAAPHLFARVVELPPRVTEDDLQAWRQFSAGMHDALGSKAPVVQSPAPAGVVRGEAAPNVGQVLRLYQQHT